MMILGYTQTAEFFGSFDDSGDEPHDNMPLDVAVEEPDARVVGFEAQNDVGFRIHGNGVALHRVTEEAARDGRKTWEDATV